TPITKSRALLLEFQRHIEGKRAPLRGVIHSIEPVRLTYESTKDLFAIRPGLETAMGSHQGSMRQAMNSVRKIRTVVRLAKPSGLDRGLEAKQIGGVITIKKLLSRTTIVEGMHIS